MVKRYGIIVDGYSTGAGLAKEFAKYDIQCLHIQSKKNIPHVYKHTFDSLDYEKNFIYDDSIESIQQALAEYSFEFVIAGAECGIELADQLANALNLPCNDIQLSSHRRNKHLMMERVDNYGLQSIPTFHSTELKEILNWANKQTHWPLIVKPVNSAGGEGVRICNFLEDIKEACLAITDQAINMLGFKNNGVLIQHFITGKEYVVNTVSYDGHHKVCEIWEYTRYIRSNGRQIYDTALIIDYDATKHRNILEYAMNVLNALGVKYGPAHVEILVNEAGCYLVELGARLMGANLPFALLAKCINTAQAIMAVFSYAEPRKFLDKIDLPYKILQPLLALFMVTDKKGTIKKITHLDEIKKCPSFFAMKLAVTVGQKIYPTIDYQTSPGMIYLSHSDYVQIQLDRTYIRDLEKSMFELESERDIEVHLK